MEILPVSFGLLGVFHLSYCSTNQLGFGENGMP